MVLYLCCCFHLFLRQTSGIFLGGSLWSHVTLVYFATTKVAEHRFGSFVSFNLFF